MPTLAPPDLPTAIRPNRIASHVASHIEHYGPDLRRSDHWYSPPPPGWEVAYLFGEGQDIATFDELAERAYLALPIQQRSSELGREDRADTWLMLVYEILRRHRRQLLADDRALVLYSDKQPMPGLCLRFTAKSRKSGLKNIPNKRAGCRVIASLN